MSDVLGGFGAWQAADLPKITQALYQRGYTREQIIKILGGNFMRVMREVEATAKRLQNENQSSDALSFHDIELMAANRVSTAQLVENIKRRGVNFELTPECRGRLRAEKVEDSALDVMAKARRK